MIEVYRTLRESASDEFTVNKSRFIGHGCPCETEEEALAFLSKVREQYKDARHNCYAYIIGLNSGIMRYSDDGEPGGTAGLPMMDVLRGAGVVNCCVVVTRYFGGILLGTGGLVRAYTQAAKLALQASGVVSMEQTCHDLCEVPYSEWDKVTYALGSLPAKTANVSYASSVSFTLMTRVRDHDAVLDSLMAASGRKLISLPDEDSYEAWEVKE